MRAIRRRALALQHNLGTRVAAGFLLDILAALKDGDSYGAQAAIA